METFLDHLKLNSTTMPGGYRVQIVKAFLQELGDILGRSKDSFLGPRTEEVVPPGKKTWTYS